ncbi:MAG: alpha/beta hydrolase-fold protein [Myxococcota bacterium]|nr:alpha/beta hydrolase-fold protein [Myxococcota bacterium]
MSTRRLRTWYSERVGKEMTVARWGWYGTPVILFPTAAADCLDYERFLLIDALEPMLESGRIKVYAVESVTGESWMNSEAPPWHRSWMQKRFDEYVEHELLPFIEHDCEGYRGYVAAGSSIGAYNAVNSAAKHPSWFSHVVAMSGTYDFDRWMGGHRDQDYYFNQPMYYLAGVPEGQQLDGIRRIKWTIASGQGRAEAPDESRRIAALLRGRGAQVDLQIWGRDAHHDWPTWRTMLPLFLDRQLP